MIIFHHTIYNKENLWVLFKLSDWNDITGKVNVRKNIQTLHN